MTRRARLTVPLSVAPSAPYHEPDISAEHKAAVLAALRWAWAELTRDDPAILRSGGEEAITERLQQLLNERRNGERRAVWLKDFETVTRGESQRTADARIGKRPDLTFRPPAYPTVVSAARWGWFIECKIINGRSSVMSYRDAGVRRYTTGEYAAWMPSGAMVAYVRDGSRPATKLRPVLTGHVGTRRCKAGPGRDRTESEHDRSALAQPCVDVTLIHLWLQVR